MLFSPCNNGNEIQGVPRYDQTLLNSAVPVLFKPLGVQLIGARFDDHRLLGIANWLEKECNN